MAASFRPRSKVMTLEQARPLLGPPWLLEGEDPDVYERLLAGVGEAIGPRDLIDWLLIKSIVALTWEIERARRLSAGLMRLRRREALEAILRELLPKSEYSLAGEPSEELTAQWVNGDEAAVKKVEAMFAKAGYILTDLDAQTLSHHAADFDRIDARAQRCEERRAKMLQQIELRREGAAKPVLDASEDVVEAQFQARPLISAAANGEGAV